MPPPSSDSVISLPDYERAFRTIHGLVSAETSDSLSACLYFGVMGAAILAHHYGLPARPVVGMAAYRLNGRVLVFAEPVGSTVRATPDGFHCWVEVEGLVVDFQAPLFGEVLQRQGVVAMTPRWMMQKRLDQANASLASMASSGSHWHEADENLQNNLLGAFSSKPANNDLTAIALEWFQPTPRPMQPVLSVGDQRGRITRTPLSPLRVSGRW